MELHRLPNSLKQVTGPGLAVLASICLLAVWPAESSAGSQRYKAMLSVTGDLTVTSQHDSLGNCTPGQAWTLTEGAKVDVQGKVIIERVGPRLLNSTAAMTPGGATSTNQLVSYEETNYCLPDEPIKIEKPKCRTRTGRGTAGLFPDPRGTNPPRVSVGVRRDTGGNQTGDCTSIGITDSTPFGSELSSLDTIYSEIDFPLDLRVSSFKTLGIGKRLIRTIHIGGPCDGAVVYRGTKVSKAAEGDCEVDGDFKVVIRRLTKSSKEGVPLS